MNIYELRTLLREWAYLHRQLLTVNECYHQGWDEAKHIYLRMDDIEMQLNRCNCTSEHLESETDTAQNPEISELPENRPESDEESIRSLTPTELRELDEMEVYTVKTGALGNQNAAKQHRSSCCGTLGRKRSGIDGMCSACRPQSHRNRSRWMNRRKHGSGRRRQRKARKARGVQE
jgi:hypothetical protein